MPDIDFILDELRDLRRRVEFLEQTLMMKSISAMYYPNYQSVTWVCENGNWLWKPTTT